MFEIGLISAIVLSALTIMGEFRAEFTEISIQSDFLSLKLISES